MGHDIDISSQLTVDCNYEREENDRAVRPIRTHHTIAKTIEATKNEWNTYKNKKKKQNKSKPNKTKPKESVTLP